MSVALRGSVVNRSCSELIQWNTVVFKDRKSVDILRVVLQIVLGITSLLLTMLILLHKGQGGGMSQMFGGGMSSSLSSSGVAQKNLNRFTVVLGITWVTVIIAMGLLMRFTGA